MSCGFASPHSYDWPPFLREGGSAGFWLRRGCGFCRTLPESAELSPLSSLLTMGVAGLIIRRSSFGVLPRIEELKTASHDSNCLANGFGTQSGSKLTVLNTEGLGHRNPKRRRDRCQNPSAVGTNAGTLAMPDCSS